VRTAGRTVVFFEAPHRIEITLRELQDAIGDRPIAIARELTKAYEEWVRGPISTVVSGLDTPRGEFTVVVDIGQTTESGQVVCAAPSEILVKFGELTASDRQSRTQAVRTLAKRYGLPRNEVYAAIEQAKKSGK